jgi:hypothetical protein
MEEERLVQPLSEQARAHHSRALALFRALQDAGFEDRGRVGQAA